MRDFTLTAYQLLLNKIKEKEYSFQTLEEYFTNPLPRVVVLRHDVDSWPDNALQMASMEAKANIKATYYFRISPLSFDSVIIRQIAAMGHEIGYHYEDFAACNGNYIKAIESFKRNLERFRLYYPVKTIAMHGRPLSKWHNLDIWKKYRFLDYGLLGEPYLSLDFNKLLYLTDAGNRWDGSNYSIRDEVQSAFKFKIHSTFDMIKHLDQCLLPDLIMLNAHPSRWNENLVKWIVRYYVLTLPKCHIKKWLKQWRKR